MAEEAVAEEAVEEEAVAAVADKKERGQRGIITMLVAVLS